MESYAFLVRLIKHGICFFRVKLCCRRMSSSTIGGGGGDVTILSPVLGGDGTKIAPTGYLFDQPLGEIS